MDKIRIEGIKLSHELSQVNLLNHPYPQNTLSRLCLLLAANRINISFISAACPDKSPQASFCVAIDDDDRVRRLINEDPDLKTHIKFISSVGLLSVFPQQSSLPILGLAFYALGKARLPVYGLGLSLSALTFVTDYACLDAAAAALETHLELPPNQRPFRTEMRVTQSQIKKGDRPPGHG